jgi:5-methylcytosine-specific restriction endonuclease McrA
MAAIHQERMAARSGCAPLVSEQMCRVCLIIKPAADFSGSKANKSGLAYQCKPCTGQRSAAWRQSNADYVKASKREYGQRNRAILREKDRRYRASRPPEAVKAWRDRYMAEHGEKVAAYKAAWSRENTGRLRESRRRYQETHQAEIAARGRAWYAADPQRTKQQVAAWRKANPQRVADTNRRHRALKMGGPGYVDPADWLALCDAVGNRCLACGATGALEQDHVIPLSRGGLHVIENLQPLCRSCNARKHTQATDYRLSRHTNGADL